MQVFVRVNINTGRCDGGNVAVAIDGEKATEVEVKTKDEAQEVDDNVTEEPVSIKEESEA